MPYPGPIQPIRSRSIGLTPAAVKAHRSGTLIDPSCPGLRHVVSGRARSWLYRYRQTDGRMKQMKLADGRVIDLHDARELWKEAKTLREHGIDPADRKRAVKQTRREAIEKTGVYTV